MNSHQQAEATAESSTEWAVGSPNLGPVLDPHPCHAGQAIDREKGVGRGWIRSRLWTWYVLRFGAWGMQQHGPYNNCGHEAATDTGIKTCQWLKVQKMTHTLTVSSWTNDVQGLYQYPSFLPPPTPHEILMLVRDKYKEEGITLDWLSLSEFILFSAMSGGLIWKFISLSKICRTATLSYSHGLII